MLRLLRTVTGSACALSVGCASATPATSSSPGTASAASEEPPAAVVEAPSSTAREDVQSEAGPHLDKKQIRVVVSDHIEDIRGCYNAGLATDPALSGRVTIEFVIGSEGAVLRSTVVGSELPESANGVSDCIARAIETWTFSRKGGENNIIVSYPFNLSPGEVVYSKLGGT